MADQRNPRRGPPRERSHDRGGFVPHRPAFAPRPGPPAGAAEHVHSLRLRDGDREIEVSGSAAFVRQALDDLPVLLARLRGERHPIGPASISLPRPPVHGLAAAAESLDEEVPLHGGNGDGSLRSPEEQVLAVLREAKGPLGIADIRQRLADRVSGQQVRRILERAADRVTSVGGRPALYRLR